jgi:CubicO group peptidase (beta-lactamase class C family)
MWRRMPKRYAVNRNGAGLAIAVALCAAMLGATSCSAPGHPKPSKSADPLATAIAAEMNGYTYDANIRAIIVQVDGRTRFEHYYSSSAGQSRSSFSVTKSVMSTLVGIAISEGRLRLDERLDEMLPRQAAKMSPRVARVTLRQILTMTAGFPDTWIPNENDPLDAAPNWTNYILAHQDRAPGMEWHYSDYGAHLLSPILVQATGQSVLSYARAKLFDPLGISSTPAVQSRIDPAHLPEYLHAHFAWPVDPQGFNLGAAWIKLRPRDMAALGQLYLQGGLWHGKPVVPAEWVRQATTSQCRKAVAADLPEHGAFDPQNYGFLWWVEKTDGADAYFALGFGGQRIEVVPSRHLVIVVSSDIDLTAAHPEIVGPDDTERLIDIIARLAH